MPRGDARKARIAAGTITTPDRAKKVERRKSDVPVLYRGLYERVAAGEASHREAIKAQCLECVCWQRREVTRCTALACPLYLYRPYQDPEEEGDHECAVDEPSLEGSSQPLLVSGRA